MRVYMLEFEIEVNNLRKLYFPTNTVLYFQTFTFQSDISAIRVLYNVPRDLWLRFQLIDN